MRLERDFFPMRTADRLTSPWPKKSQPLWVVVRTAVSSAMGMSRDRPCALGRSVSLASCSTSDKLTEHKRSEYEPCGHEPREHEASEHEASEHEASEHEASEHKPDAYEPSAYKPTYEELYRVATKGGFLLRQLNLNLTSIKFI
eukprot:2708405-Pyramimonas_sp.AAC.2